MSEDRPEDLKRVCLPVILKPVYDSVAALLTPYQSRYRRVRRESVFLVVDDQPCVKRWVENGFEIATLTQFELPGFAFFVLISYFLLFFDQPLQHNHRQRSAGQA